MTTVHEMIEANCGYHLPVFPTFYGQCSENRIERAIEKLVDHADKAFMAGKATQAQYDNWNRALNAWAERCFSALALNPESKVTP